MSLLVDLLLVVCFLLTMISGIRSGFFRELFGFLGLVGGVVLGLRFAPELQTRLPDVFAHSGVVWTLLFVVIVIAVYVVAQLVGGAFSTAWEGKKPSGASRLLGLVLGGLRGFVLVLFLAGAIVLLSPPDSKTLAGSRVLPQLTGGVTWSSRVLPPKVRSRLLERWDYLYGRGAVRDPSNPASSGGRLSPA